MRKINQFGRRLSIYRRAERPDVDTTAMRFRDHSSALNFLRSVKSGGANMAVLRDVLRTEATGVVVHRLGDQEVLEHLARKLCAGWIKVHERTTRFAGGDRQVGDAKEGASGWAPNKTGRKPRREPRPAPPPRQKPAPAPVVPPKMDIEAQIAVLKAAAQAGTPFCEPCERARLQREAAQ